LVTAAVAFGASLGFMTIGKIGIGAYADRWGARPTFVYSAVITALGIGILMLADPLWVVIVFTFVFGFPQGAPLTLTPMVTADCHGLANFGAIFGTLTFFSIVGAAIGPVVVGKMYDTTQPHTYQGAFVLLIVITLISGYCIHRARPTEDFGPAADESR
jgi:MFS family permease